MRPTNKFTNLIKAMSVLQIFLVLGCLGLLFSSEFATLKDYYAWTDVYGETNYNHDWITLNYSNNIVLSVLAPVFAILFVLIAGFGITGVWRPSGQTGARMSKITGVLGILLIMLTVIAAIGVSLTWGSDVAPGTKPDSWWLGTSFYGFLVFGFIFAIIGFAKTRMTRFRQDLPPPPPPPPPPPA
jgi:hypothetical protein